MESFIFYAGFIFLGLLTILTLTYLFLWSSADRKAERYKKERNYYYNHYREIKDELSYYQMTNPPRPNTDDELNDKIKLLTEENKSLNERMSRLLGTKLIDINNEK